MRLTFNEFAQLLAKNNTELPSTLMNVGDQWISKGVVHTWDGWFWLSDKESGMIKSFTPEEARLIAILEHVHPPEVNPVWGNIWTFKDNEYRWDDQYWMRVNDWKLDRYKISKEKGRWNIPKPEDKSYTAKPNSSETSIPNQCVLTYAAKITISDGREVTLHSCESHRGVIVEWI